MTRLEALRAAKEMIDQSAAPPRDERGYPPSGWRGPTWEERHREILRYAAFLLGEDPDA